ncbi:hypothetical protein KSS87_016230 [Heliosperma pusillum]|nr:hypothetical protein KSS87_016230 [Heliosperma pusillum]
MAISKHIVFSFTLVFISLISFNELVAVTGDTNKYFKLPLGPNQTGPEAIAFDCKGKGPYVGISDGRILKWQGSHIGWTTYAVTAPNRSGSCDGVDGIPKEKECGRPLGIRFDMRTCELYIADSSFGLMKVGPKGGVASSLATMVHGVPFVFLNSLDIDFVNNVIYFSETSTNYPHWKAGDAINNGDKSGRLMKYDVKTGAVTVLLTGLSFANGVSLSKNNDFVLVAETTANQTLKYWLSGYKAGTHEVIHLNGRPDNINRDANGDFWIAVQLGKSVKINPFGKILETLEGDEIVNPTDVSEFNHRLCWLAMAVSKHIVFTLVLIMSLMSSIELAVIPYEININYTRLSLGQNQTGPEAIAFDCKGEGPYVGISDGRILKWQGPHIGWTTYAVTAPNRPDWCDGVVSSPLEDVCGRPLGLRFDMTTCELYVADSSFGLMKVCSEGGVASSLATIAEGIPFVFTNDLDVDFENNIVYFTDTSTNYPRWEALQAINNGDHSGRFMKYDMKTREVTVLLRDLYFANGVALSKYNDFVLVAETTANQTLKYWLTGYKAGSYEVLLQLDGRPDNIKRDANGDFWIAVGPKGGVATSLAAIAEGIPFGFLNGLDVDFVNKAVYFTDSTRDGRQAINNSDNSGRFMKYDMKTGDVTVLLKNLFFANGVALNKNNDFVLVAETTANQTLKYWLTGYKAGSSEVLLQLDGEPDNINRNTAGDFWIAVRMGKSIKINHLGVILETLDGDEIVNPSDVSEFHHRLWIGFPDQPFIYHS